MHCKATLKKEKMIKILTLGCTTLRVKNIKQYEGCFIKGDSQ